MLKSRARGLRFLVKLRKLWRIPLLLLAACYDQSTSGTFKGRWQRLRQTIGFRAWNVAFKVEAPARQVRVVHALAQEHRPQPERQVYRRPQHVVPFREVASPRRRRDAKRTRRPKRTLSRRSRNHRPLPLPCIRPEARCPPSTRQDQSLRRGLPRRRRDRRVLRLRRSRVRSRHGPTAFQKLARPFPRHDCRAFRLRKRRTLHRPRRHRLHLRRAESRTPARRISRRCR